MLARVDAAWTDVVAADLPLCLAISTRSGGLSDFTGAAAYCLLLFRLLCFQAAYAVCSSRYTSILACATKGILKGIVLLGKKLKSTGFMSVYGYFYT